MVYKYVNLRKKLMHKYVDLRTYKKPSKYASKLKSSFLVGCLDLVRSIQAAYILSTARFWPLGLSLSCFRYNAWNLLDEIRKRVFCSYCAQNRVQILCINKRHVTRQINLSLTKYKKTSTILKFSYMFRLNVQCEVTLFDYQYTHTKSNLV